MMIYNLCRKKNDFVSTNNYKAKLNLFIVSTSTDEKKTLPNNSQFTADHITEN